VAFKFLKAAAGNFSPNGMRRLFLSARPHFTAGSARSRSIAEFIDGGINTMN